MVTPRMRPEATVEAVSLSQPDQPRVDLEAISDPAGRGSSEMVTPRQQPEAMGSSVSPSQPDQPRHITRTITRPAGRGTIPQTPIDVTEARSELVFVESSPNPIHGQIASQRALGGVGGEDASQDPPTPLTQATAPSVGPDPGYYLVVFLADIVDDLEKARIANQNRLRTLTDTGDWGKAVTNKEAEYVAALVDQIAALEHGAILQLKRAVRQSPLAQFVKDTKGLGEKTLGRLIKETGDPAWNSLEDRPRSLRELYAYCGLHVVAGKAPTRRKGVRANWSTAAKTRLYLIAEAMLKNRQSAYRTIYDDARLKYADAVHPSDCVRCGPSGKPALAGSPLSAGHQHARAMRLVSKAVLADIWEAAMVRYRPDQPTTASQAKYETVGLVEATS